MRSFNEEAIATIPLPERPGTLWEGNAPYYSSCRHCHKPYSSHGAPRDVAEKFGVRLDSRHLICPASDEAWDAYNTARRRATVELCIEDFKRSLLNFDWDERRQIVSALNAELL